MNLSDSRESDPTDTPPYVALSFDGQCIDADDDLEALLSRLAEDAREARRDFEELAVWHDAEELVAVVKSDGTIHRTDVPGSCQPAQDGRSGNGQAKRRR